MKEQANEFLKFKNNYEIEREVLETTSNQQMKFINFVLTEYPDLSKKYK